MTQVKIAKRAMKAPIANSEADPLVPALPLTTAERDRSLAAIVALTTHCALGGAVRWPRDGYLRRDWLLFVPVAPGERRSAEAAETARALDCDLIVAEFAPDRQVTFRVGIRLWNRLAWRSSLRLWRDDTGGRCCLINVGERAEHLWLESGRVVAHAGPPWRNGADRDLGFARADAAFRRMAREG